MLSSARGRPGPGPDYAALPRATFTDPEIGGVGLAEAQAHQQGIPVRTVTKDLSVRGWIHGNGGDGLIKLVVDADRDLLVEATTAGPAGGEVLGMLSLAVRAAVPVAHDLHLPHLPPRRPRRPRRPALSRIPGMQHAWPT